VDPDAIRERATAMCNALVAGDVELATQDFSPELHRNLGEVLSLLPLPASEAVVESVERGGSGLVVVLRIVGETDEATIQTRWKDRDGRPMVVEAGHLSRTARAIEAAAEAETGADANG
jgi:hypothetical protein